MLEVKVGVGAIGAGKPLATAPIQVCWGALTVQTSWVPRHQRGLPTGMTDAEESLREPCVLRGGEDLLTLFLILGLPVGLQMWRLHFGLLLGATSEGFCV